MITEKSPEQLAREDLIRQTLERAAKMLENKQKNELYERAWRIAARFIREMSREMN